MIANVYTPPPFKTEILLDLLKFVEDKAAIPIIAVGDLNAVLDSSLDRFLPVSRPERVSEGRLDQFLGEIGWCDLWRSHTQQYSCYSGSYSTLSHIDMAMGNSEALQLTKK